MYNLKRLKPILLEDLVRIGRNTDGGYVLSKKQIEKTDLLLSFGINMDWSFEEDFLKHRQAKLYAFDHSVSHEIFKHKSSLQLLYLLANTATFRIMQAKQNFKSWRHIARRAKEFKQFFQKEQGRYFIPKFVGEYDNDVFVRLDTIFSTLLNDVKDLSVFIKMDVDDWEYRTLTQLPRFLDKVNGLVVEFHQLDFAEKKFEEIIDLLSDKFYVAHVHGNNNGGLVYGTNLPKVLEVTFIHKDIVVNDNSLIHININKGGGEVNYPLNGLDFPCNPYNDEIQLNF